MNVPQDQLADRAAALIILGSVCVTAALYIGAGIAAALAFIGLGLLYLGLRMTR